MKNKIIILSLILTMPISLCACGNKKEDAKVTSVVESTEASNESSFESSTETEIDEIDESDVSTTYTEEEKQIYEDAEQAAEAAPYYDISTILNDTDLQSSLNNKAVVVGGIAIDITDKGFTLVDSADDTSGIDVEIYDEYSEEPADLSLSERIDNNTELIVSGVLSIDEDKLKLDGTDYFDIIPFYKETWGSITYCGDDTKSAEYFNKDDFDSRGYWKNFEGNNLSKLFNAIDTDMNPDETSDPIWIKYYKNQDKLNDAKDALAN